MCNPISGHSAPLAKPAPTQVKGDSGCGMPTQTPDAPDAPEQAPDQAAPPVDTAKAAKAKSDAAAAAVAGAAGGGGGASDTKKAKAGKKDAEAGAEELGKGRVATADGGWTRHKNNVDPNPDRGNDSGRGVKGKGKGKGGDPIAPPKGGGDAPTQVDGESGPPKKGDAPTQVDGESGPPAKGGTEVGGETGAPAKGDEPTQVDGESGAPAKGGTEVGGETGETEVPAKGDEPTQVDGEIGAPAKGDTDVEAEGGGPVQQEPVKEPAPVEDPAPVQEPAETAPKTVFIAENDYVNQVSIVAESGNEIQIQGGQVYTRFSSRWREFQIPTENTLIELSDGTKVELLYNDGSDPEEPRGSIAWFGVVQPGGDVYGTSTSDYETHYRDGSLLAGLDEYQLMELASTLGSMAVKPA